MRPSIWILPLFAACSPRAVTPPARTFVMDSPALATGKGDLQADVSRVATFWGPELTSGNGRLRRAVSDETILEGEVGVLHVTNSGDAASRDAYTGRVGAIWRTEDQFAAIGVGIGGGMSPAAGSWGAVDAGVLLSGTHRYIRPILEGDLGYSAPFDDSRTFSVTESDGTRSTLRLPHNATGKLTFGLELGDRTASMLLGLSFIKFWQAETSRVGSDEPPDNDVYVALGLGFRVGID